MKTNLLALAVLGVVSACAHGPTTASESETEGLPASTEAVSRRHPVPDRLATLPDQASYADLYEFADTLEIKHVDLRLHEGSGSSIYGVIYRDGKQYGALIPPNSSGHPSGEIFAWTLSRALGVPELYQSGISIALEGHDVKRFMKLVPSSPQRSDVKEQNRLDLLRNYKKDPKRLEIAFKRWDVKPHDWPEAPPITLAELGPSA